MGIKSLTLECGIGDFCSHSWVEGMNQWQDHCKSRLLHSLLTVAWWITPKVSGLTSFITSQISVCQERSHNLAGSPGSGSVHRLPSRCRRGMQSPSDSTESGATSKFTQVVVGRFQFFAGYWTDSFSSSQAVGCPFHGIAHNTAIGFISTSQWKKKNGSEMGVTVFVV